MRTGMGPEGVVRDGRMPYAGTSRWQDEDLKVLWASCGPSGRSNTRKSPGSSRGPGFGGTRTPGEGHVRDLLHWIATVSGARMVLPRTFPLPKSLQRSVTPSVEWFIVGYGRDRPARVRQGPR